MLTESQTPELEELAAYIDGRLSGERKQSVEERLLRDEDFYEIYLDTVRFQEQDTGAEEGGRVLPWRSWQTAVPRKVAAVAVPLAAAALLVAIVGLPRLQPSPSIDDWVVWLDARDIVGQKNWDDSGLRRMRGEDVRSEDLEVAFQMGVKSVELRVALATGQREAAEEIAGWLAAKADNTEFLFVAPAAYSELQEQIQDRDLEGLLVKVKSAEVEFSTDSPEGRRFTLGAWSEAGRLAALSRKGDALTRIFQGDPGVDAVDEIAAQIDKLETILDQPELSEADFEEATQTFRRIIQTLAG